LLDKPLSEDPGVGGQGGGKLDMAVRSCGVADIGEGSREDSGEDAHDESLRLVRSASRAQRLRAADQGNINCPVSPSNRCDASGGSPDGTLFVK
jgi:hypothetical protein